MTSSTPFIPAEAGTQCFGNKVCDLHSMKRATGYQMAQTWVPASAGMNGVVQ
jgi:hypothetical protein